MEAALSYSVSATSTSRSAARSQSQAVPSIGVTAQILDRSFEHEARLLDIPGLTICDGNLRHQGQGLRMIRTEEVLIRTKGREHRLKFGLFGRYGGGHERDIV